MSTLLKEHHGLIVSLARKFPAGEREDLIAVGMTALWEASLRFEPRRGLLFSNYAYHVVLGKMQNWWRDCQWEPRRRREARIRLLRAGQEVPADLEPPALYSLDAPLPDGSLCADLLVDPAPPVGAEAERADWLRAALETLPARDAWLLKARYLEGRGQEELARALGLSPMTIRRHERAALAALRGWAE